MPTVLVRDLKKSYDGLRAADGVSFEVEAGEIFGLIGPNGAGKTTTIECLLGLRQPDSGEISICGIDARREPRQVRQKIGAALQTTALQDKITPREALALFGGFYARHAEPQPLLERFALLDKADAPFDSLSGGQRQRLALALAFVNDPEVVFLDEPTAGLDPQARRELHDDIVQMKVDGRTVLLTTHDLAEAELLCDRIAIINRGRVIAAGAPRQLMGRSQSSQSVSLVSNRPLARDWLTSVAGVDGLEGDGCNWRFHCAHVSLTLLQVIQLLESRQIGIAELHVQNASLEDVFLELTAAS